eukprot:19901-Heterococcus_DN1.PRE.10
MCATRDTNKFLTDQAPWLIKGEGPDLTAQRIEFQAVSISVSTAQLTAATAEELVNSAASLKL